MDHPNLIEKNNTIQLAREILAQKQNYLILDTETTGLKEKDVIIQMAVIDLNGNVLVDSLVKPLKRKSISREAAAIHGISSKHLQSAPYFADVFYDLIPHLEARKQFLIYNFEFDTRLIRQTFIADGINYPGKMHGECIMKEYAKFTGQWNTLTNDYRYQRLPGGNHSAKGDCLATLDLIKMLAEQELTLIPEDYKPAVRLQATESEIEAQTSLVILFIGAFFVFVLLWLISKC